MAPLTVSNTLVVIDSFSRYTWLFPTKSTGSKETIKHLFISNLIYFKILILLYVWSLTEAQHLRHKNSPNF